jgi:hypothetical protein
MKYDRLKTRLDEAKAKTAKAKSQHDHAKAHEATIEAEFNEVRTALDAALDATASAGTKKVAVPVPQPKTAAVHVPPYLRELVAAFPAAGATDLESLRAALGLPATTVNTRIQKAKKLGLVVRSGRAEYSLTDLGKSSRGGRFQAVGGQG